MQNLKMIVAVDSNWGIGKNGDLLFSIPEDMKFFRTTTQGSTVIMGRKTLDSFPGGKPLKNRENIVLTNNASFEREGAIVCFSKEEVLEKVKNAESCFVIGGAAIYDMFLENCSVAYITKVFANGDADRFITNLDDSCEWELTEQSEEKEDNGYKFVFCKYERIK